MNDHQPKPQTGSRNPIVVVVVSVGAMAIILICCLVLGQALIQARGEAARTRAANNLAQVEAALENYHAVSEGAPLAPADTLRLLAWNIESGGNAPEVIAEQLVQLQQFPATQKTIKTPRKT